ncbi:acyltransferase [Rathayibacter sp. VKM Ac-2760]|uniref:acyltransferase n=1 Tax=Rathayibacter sp. VKM Ac-2760 TaxID=2609253 RepID=UPI00131853B1|nr:acyltransferase [Rathayibacter sp. VKM Ac-2760]QHC60054.1 acyltransferase [Rathayibacter sp. VKM Ac-2760]
MGLGIRIRAVELAEAAAYSPLLSARLRWRALRALGWRDLAAPTIKRGGWINGHRLSIGPGGFLAVGVYLDAAAPITIGREVMIGPHAMVLTSTHAVGGPERRGGASEYHPVSIGDGCWIGAGAIVLPGVAVAAGCVIAAGAVVTEDTEPHGLYGGVPARRLKDLPV